MQGDGKKYSVIIRCRNESRWIGHAIQSVIDHIYTPEVIIIDNESNDDSMSIVRMFAHHVDIHVHQIKNYSPGFALNVGAKAASYPNILILSAHCVLDVFDGDKYSSLLSEHVAVFGKQIPVYRGRRIIPRYVWSNFADQPSVNPISKMENRPFLHNAMCVYKSEVLRENPFDEKLYGKEDRYWAQSMIDKGFSIYYDPSMRCHHHWTAGGATWMGLG